MESIFFSFGVPQQRGEEVIAAITRRMKERINAKALNPKKEKKIGKEKNDEYRCQEEQEK